MGNASSSNAAPQPKVADGSDSGGDNNDASSSGGGSMFRLPLYRGERDVFLPINDHHYVEDEDDGYGQGYGDSLIPASGEDGSPPPLLSIRPKILSNNSSSQLLISPLNNADNDNLGHSHSHGASVRTPTGKHKPPQQFFSPVSNAAERPPEISPPSVISSSDSSYGTCYSSMSSSQQTSWGGSGSGSGGSSASERYCGQSGNGNGWLYSTSTYSTHLPSQNKQRSILPVPLPKPIPKRDVSARLGMRDTSSDKGIFDCVRPTVQRIPPTTATTPTPQHMSMTHHKKISSISSASLTSLFETCVRTSQDENEYADDEDCSDQGSYYSAGQNNYSRNHGYGRSLSTGSQATQCSQYSNMSHNSYDRSTSLQNVASKSSLVSAFSNATSNVSQMNYYAPEELDMPDGDGPTYGSDLRRVRDYHVVTTAALPWMTGTAVNPLLRAGYLLRRNGNLRKASNEFEDDMGGSLFDVPSPPLLQRRHAKMEQEDATPIKSNKSPGVKRLMLEDPALGEHLETDKPDDNSTLSSPVEGTNAENLKAPPSPCSLDYSCFSFSEIDTPNNIEPNPRELISPLGEEDSLLLSPFTPGAPLGNATTIPLNDVNGIAQTEQIQGQVVEGRVTLVLPWLQDASDRRMLYGVTSQKKEDGTEEEVPMFANEGEQEEYIRSWLADEAGMPEEAKELHILFYPARYHKRYNSIFALGDICDLIPNESADVCILEEPEHLNWYRAPGNQSWSSKFCHCVGVIHTNYKAYARDHAPAGFLAAPLLAGVNSLVVRAHCHRVVKLSGILQEFVPMNECVENVHGIRETYLKEGQRRRLSTAVVGGTEKRKAYFIGKLLWAKGFDQLLELQASFCDRTGEYFDIDIFGSGPDEEEIQRAFYSDQSSASGILNSFNKWNSSRRPCLPANFMGKVDHSSLAGDKYSIFINPSLTEVLCTTTAEAIAMGKWAIIPSHPSNAFFVQFPNCLPYRNRREFVSTLKYALANDPPHLSDELMHLLSWEAATMRCVHAATVSKRDAARNERVCRAKEEKTLKKTLSGLWSGSKGDLQTMNDNRVSSSSSLDPSGYGSVALITP